MFQECRIFSNSVLATSQMGLHAYRNRAGKAAYRATIPVQRFDVRSSCSSTRIQCPMQTLVLEQSRIYRSLRIARPIVHCSFPYVYYRLDNFASSGFIDAGTVRLTLQQLRSRERHQDGSILVSRSPQAYICPI